MKPKIRVGQIWRDNLVQYLKFKIVEGITKDHYRLKIWNDKENDWADIDLHTDEDWSEGKTSEWIYNNLELEEDVPALSELGTPSKLSLIE